MDEPAKGGGMIDLLEQHYLCQTKPNLIDAISMMETKT